ncbi:MAG: RNA polymerase sigma factor [Clostridium sp.]
MHSIKEKELSKIYDETHKEVLRYVVSKCHNQNDIDDIIQNIYLSFYKRLCKNIQIDSPIKYLITIAKHELYKHYGVISMTFKNVNIFSKGDDDSFDELEYDLAQKELNIDSLLCSEIWTYIKGLDLITFKIFVLHYSHDMKLKDISQTLKLKESTVKNKLYRALKSIRKEFNREDDLNDGKRII